MLASLKDFMTQQNWLLPVYEDFIRNARITLSVSPGSQKLHFEAGGGPYHELLVRAREGGAATLTDLFVNAHFFIRGPKIYRPSADNCFALEAVRPEVLFHEYHQPFETFAIELPPEYSQARTVQGVRPIVVILHLLPDSFLLTMLVWSNGTSTVNSLMPASEQETVEQLVACVHGRIWENSLPFNNNEATFTESAVRLGVNACMLLTHYGVRRIGHDNPTHAARLEGYLAKARKRKEGVEKAQRDVRALPVVYGFAQDVKLYEREEAGYHGADHKGDGFVAPHWRAGHWRSQPCGPARSERKPTFIRPVLVNGHLLAGKESETSVVYRPAR